MMRTKMSRPYDQSINYDENAHMQRLKIPAHVFTSLTLNRVRIERIEAACGHTVSFASRADSNARCLEHRRRSIRQRNLESIVESCYTRDSEEEQQRSEFRRTLSQCLHDGAAQAWRKTLYGHPWSCYRTPYAEGKTAKVRLSWRANPFLLAQTQRFDKMWSIRWIIIFWRLSTQHGMIIAQQWLWYETYSCTWTEFMLVAKNWSPCTIWDLSYSVIMSFDVHQYVTIWDRRFSTWSRKRDAEKL